MSSNSEYSQIAKNTVPAENQLKTKASVFTEKSESLSGKKILFVGNSITLHGINEELGWLITCGMAASSPEKDYVHILEKKVSEKTPDVSFCICQAAGWERNYLNGSEHHEEYKSARDFDADIIIMRLIENCPVAGFNADAFSVAYRDFIDYLNKSKKATIILTTGFWKHPGDKAIENVGKLLGYKTIYLGDLGDDNEMMAIGLFEHSGVARHPGDKGMAAIADRIWNELEKEL